MKRFYPSAATLALAVFCSTTAADPTFIREPMVSPPPNVHVFNPEPLDAVAMESTRGGIGPLAIALGVAGIDIALMGFFWGVYVPYYAPQGPSYYTEAP